VLEPFLVFVVVLLLRSCDPVLAFDSLRIGRKFLGDFLHIIGLPSGDLDKRPGTELLQGFGKDWADTLDFLKIIALPGLAAFGRTAGTGSLGPIGAELGSGGRYRSRWRRAQGRTQFAQAFLEALDLLVLFWNALNLILENLAFGAEAL